MEQHSEKLIEGNHQHEDFGSKSKHEYEECGIPAAAAEEKAEMTPLLPILHRLMLVYGLFWSLNWLNNDLMSAFLRTMVECGQDTDHCLVHPGDCIARDPHDSSWSGSQFCHDKTYVVGQQTLLGGRFASVSTVLQCVAIPMLGAIADTRGRKAIMLVGFGAWLLLAGLLISTAQARTSTLQLVFLYSGAVISGLFNCFDPAALSMASDLCPDSKTKGKGMSYMFFSKQCTLMLAFGLGYWVLTLCLTDYTTVYIIYACLCGAAIPFTQVYLRENYQHLQEDSGLSIVWDNLVDGIKYCWADKFLLGFCLLAFINTAAAYGSISIMGAYCLVTLRYTQSVTSLTGIAQQPTCILGVFISKFVMSIPSIGPYRAQLLGMAIFIVAHLTMWLSAECGVMHQPVWWLGFEVAGISYGLLDTSRTTVVSMRVPDEHQAKLQGVMQMCYAAGTSVGLVIWSNGIYDANATGLAAGLGFLASAATVLGSALFYGALMLYTGVLKDSAEKDTKKIYDELAQHRDLRDTAPRPRVSGLM